MGQVLHVSSPCWSRPASKCSARYAVYSFVPGERLSLAVGNTLFSSYLYVFGLVGIVSKYRGCGPDKNVDSVPSGT